MIRYLGRRLAHGMVLLFAVSVLLFGLLQFAPGDFLSEARMNPQMSAATVDHLRAQYGLDKPLPVRYHRWLRSVVHGEFGYSFAYNLPVAQLLWPRVGHTLLLTVPALVIAWLIAIPLGVWLAARQGSWADRVFSLGTSTALALPDVLIGLLLLVFALRTHLFPVGGMHSLSASGASGDSGSADLLWHMVLPVVALVIGSLPMILRHVRSSMMEVLTTSFVRAARGHGLGQGTLLFRYALPAAANPLMSLFGLSLAGLLSVSLLVEVIMGWPGLGPMLVEAILSRDLFLVIGAVMLSTGLLVVGNFFADLMLYAVDPRIRVRR